MKIKCHDPFRVAFTLIELLVVVAIVVIMLAMFSHPHRGSREKARLIQCMSNLKQVSLGFNLWAGAQSNLIPWEVSTNAGGSQELISAGHSVDHFLPLAAFIPQASALFCPADRNFRERTDSYLGFSNTNLSYFASLEARLAGPVSLSSVILAGDRHLSISNQMANPGLLVTTNISAFGWKGFHSGRGVLLFVDGHAEVTKRDNLPAVFQRQNFATNRLVIP